MPEPSTWEASCDSNHIMSTTSSTSEIARTASQYMTFPTILIRLQA